MGSEAARRELRDRSSMARFHGRSGKRNGGPDRRLISRVDEKAREYRRPGSMVLKDYRRRRAGLGREAGDKVDLGGRVKKKIAEARKQTHEHVFHNLTTPSRGLPRIVDQPPLIYHTDLLNEREVAVVLQAVSRNSCRGAPHAVRQVQVSRLGDQGRRRRERRNALRRRASTCGTGRSLVPPVQGGAPLGAGTLHRACARTTQRPTRRRGATPDAVCERHLPGLVPGDPAVATFTSASSAT